MQIKQLKDDKWYVMDGETVVSIRLLKGYGANGIGVIREIKKNNGGYKLLPYFDNKVDATRFKDWVEALVLAHQMSSDWTPIGGIQPSQQVFVNGIALCENIDYVCSSGELQFTGNLKPGLRDIVNIVWEEIKNGDLVIKRELLTY